MATERTVRLAIALGPEPMRRWERDAIECALRVKGVVLIGYMQAEVRHTEQAMQRPGWLFGKYLARIGENDGPFGIVESLLDPGMERTRDQLAHAQPSAIICLCGETGKFAQLTRDTEVWAFRNADSVPPNPIAPGIRESFMGIPSAQFELFDRSSGRAICSGYFRTQPDDPQACAEQILAHASLWPAHALAQRAAHATPEHRISERSDAVIPFPGIGAMISYHIGRVIGRNNANASDPLDGEWNIGLLHQPIHHLLNDESSMNVRWLPSPSKGKARLEPFGYVDGNGELNVLYRKADLATGDSVIARVRPKPDNILKRSRTMLDGDSAHAYPYTLILDGALHVVCSSLTEARVDLYSVNETNDALEHRATLLDRALHAPTLFNHNNTWWLLGTDVEEGDTSLFAFHANAPSGPFSAVGVGAVKCDVRSARPAGTPFVHEGYLYRPSFDASDPHAPCVVLNKVTRLDAWGFEEEAVRRIDGFSATAYGRGVRTLSAMGEVTLVDGLRSPVVTGNKANASRGKKRRRSKTKDEDA